MIKDNRLDRPTDQLQPTKVEWMLSNWAGHIWRDTNTVIFMMMRVEITKTDQATKGENVHPYKKRREREREREGVLVDSFWWVSDISSKERMYLTQCMCVCARLHNWSAVGRMTNWDKKSVSKLKRYLEEEEKNLRQKMKATKMWWSPAVTVYLSACNWYGLKPTFYERWQCTFETTWRCTFKFIWTLMKKIKLRTWTYWWPCPIPCLPVGWCHVEWVYVCVPQSSTDMSLLVVI